jgi:very-short-patch-repair endonuclease
MFLSMVDVPGDGPHPLRNDERFKKRFNVAASRAKDQMWVVYSLDPHVDLKADDLRRRIIEFGTNPRGYSKLIAEAAEKTESEFEKQVLVRLTERGFSIVPQFSVGAYRIDMIVKGVNGRKLAIECDGDRYHPIEKLPDDMARQAILERLGWKFIRIRGSEFFRNPVQAMDRVFARLKTLQIEPGTGEQPPTTDNDSNGIVARVKARAAELRDSWAGESGAPKVIFPTFRGHVSQRGIQS